MEYQITQFLCAMADADIETRLTAVATLEHALSLHKRDAQTEWADLVGQVLPSLLRGLGDAYKGVQVHSANCLELLSPHSPAVVPALRESMAGPDTWRAWGAALVAARMGRWFPEMGPALGAALGCADRDVRWAAASLAFQLGRSQPQAVALVMDALRSANPVTRKMAAYCLGAMGSYTPVETVLAEGLDDAERDVRRATVVAIDKLPAVSAAIRSRVVNLQADPDLYVRRTAVAVAARFDQG